MPTVPYESKWPLFHAWWLGACLLAYCQPAFSAWSPISGLPSTGSDFVFAAGGGTLIAASTKADAPALFVSRSDLEFPSFTELSFNTNLLRSSWTWPDQITSLATLWLDGTPHFYAGTSGGVMEVDATPGLTNALSVVWSWTADTTVGLRRAGSNLVWSVASFGPQSGKHVWNPVTGHVGINWSRVTTVGNQIQDSSNGEVFGWTDQRSYFQYGPEVPSLLLGTSAYSMNGGSLTLAYRDTNGVAFAATSANAWGISPILVVRSSDGEVMVGSTGRSFRPMGFPVGYPTQLFFDEDTGLVIAGSTQWQFWTRLPQESNAGTFSLANLESGGFRIGFTGRGNQYRIDVSDDLSRWLPLSTNSVSASGTIEFLDAENPTFQRFYRALLLLRAD